VARIGLIQPEYSRGFFPAEIFEQTLKHHLSKYTDFPAYPKFNAGRALASAPGHSATRLRNLLNPVQLYQTNATARFVVAIHYAAHNKLQIRAYLTIIRFDSSGHSHLMMICIAMTAKHLIQRGELLYSVRENCVPLCSYDI
jgi:hypothetical protein